MHGVSADKTWHSVTPRQRTHFPSAKLMDQIIKMMNWNYFNVWNKDISIPKYGQMGEYWQSSLFANCLFLLMTFYLWTREVGLVHDIRKVSELPFQWQEIPARLAAGPWSDLPRWGGWFGGGCVRVGRQCGLKRQMFMSKNSPMCWSSLPGRMAPRNVIGMTPGPSRADPLPCIWHFFLPLAILKMGGD